MKTKKICTHYALISIMTLSLLSCKKEQNNISENTGTISIALSQDNRMIDASGRLKTNTADFIVEIHDGAGSILKTYNKVSDVPASIDLNKGEYYVVAYSNNQNSAPAFDNPIFYGQSDRFTISGGDKKNIALTCYISNLKVSVSYSDTVKNNFTNYFVKVYQLTDTLEFIKNDTREGFFKPGNIGIKAILQSNNSDGSVTEKILTGTITSARAMKHYQLSINASVIKGTGSIAVTAVDSFTTETILISENAETQSTKKTAATVTAGDILITEVMPDPDKVTDTYGEWIELYNNSTSDINIKGLILKVGTKSYTIVSNTDLKPMEYTVLAKDAQAVSNSLEIFGSALSLVNASGSVQLVAADGTTEIAYMAYTSATTGASLSLNPLKYDYTLAKDPTSWCTSTQVYSTGDKGTPGVANQSCN